MYKHVPVMLDEVLKCLNIKPNGIYIDGTLGRGGHSIEILKRLKTGHLIAFDKDETAIIKSRTRLSKVSNNFTLIHSDFKNMKCELDKMGISSVDGILLDLGVSSPQIDDQSRGFSYHNLGPLDMRMDRTQTLTAWNIINEWDEDSLTMMFYKNADVKFARQIAKAIIRHRPIDSTLQLVDIVRDALPAAVVRKKHPGKQVFQAIRIAVNDELGAIASVIKQGIHLLKKNGVLAIITFHSIEDRFVKLHFKELVAKDTGNIPIMIKPEFIAKQVRPKSTEIANNKRSKSSKLRILRKVC